MPRIPGVGDVLALLQAQTEALASLPGTLLTLNRSVRALAKAVDQSTETFATVNDLALRVHRLLDEVEAPMRALAPGAQRLAAVLDDPVMDEVPATLRQIAGTTERISSLVEDTGNRLGSLPMASLLRRQWRSAEPPSTESPPEEM